MASRILSLYSRHTVFTISPNLGEHPLLTYSAALYTGLPQKPALISAFFHGNERQLTVGCLLNVVDYIGSSVLAQRIDDAERLILPSTFPEP